MIWVNIWSGNGLYLNDCWFNTKPTGNNLRTFESKYNQFLSKSCVKKSRLPNVDHFVLGIDVLTKVLPEVRMFTNCRLSDRYELHNYVTKWKYFPRYWPFVRGIHRSPLSSPHKGQWRGALMFSSISVRTNGSVHNRDTGDLRRHHTRNNVIVMHVCFGELLFL